MLITAWGNAGLIFTVGPPSSCGVSFVIACRTVSLWRWLCAISNSGLQVCYFQQCQCLSFTGLPPSVAFVMCVLLLLFAGGVEVSSPFQNRQLPIFCHPPFWFLPGTGPDQTTQGDQEGSVCVRAGVAVCVIAWRMPPKMKCTSSLLSNCCICCQAVGSKKICYKWSMIVIFFIVNTSS